MDLPFELWAKIALDSGPVYNLVLRAIPWMGRASLKNPNFIERRYILRELWCRAIVVVPYWWTESIMLAGIFNMLLVSDNFATLRYSA